MDIVITLAAVRAARQARIAAALDPRPCQSHTCPIETAIQPHFPTQRVSVWTHHTEIGPETYTHSTSLAAWIARHDAGGPTPPVVLRLSPATRFIDLVAAPRVL